MTVWRLLLLANIIMAVINVILALVLTRLILVGRRFNATLGNYVSGHRAGEDALAPSAVPAPIAGSPLTVA